MDNNDKLFEFLDRTHLGALIGRVWDLNLAAEAPYHNNNHIIAVVTAAYNFACDDPSLTESDLQILITAAIFHDVNHSQRPDREVDNTAAAVDAYCAYVNACRQTAEAEAVIYLIQSTHFPHRPIGAAEREERPTLTHMADLLRDADVLSVLYPSKKAIEAAMVGLPKEMYAREPVRPTAAVWLAKNSRFLSEYAPYSEAGIQFKTARFDEAMKGFQQYADAHPVESAADRLERLERYLHHTQCHPGYVYDFLDLGSGYAKIDTDGWEPNVDLGNNTAVVDNGGVQFVGLRQPIPTA